MRNLRKIFYSDNMNNSLFYKDNNFDYLNPLSSKIKKKKKAVEGKKKEKISKNKNNSLIRGVEKKNQKKLIKKL